MFEDLDLTVKMDVLQDLKPDQISQNLIHLAKLTKIIKLTMNYFLCNIKKIFLFNIISGKSAKDEVVSFLLNVESTGWEACEKFIEECI